MKIRKKPLLSRGLGASRELVSFHFGPTDAVRKVYVQSGLHADELPSALVAWALKRRLLDLENADRLRAQVVLVPVANPIGLDQHLLGHFVGRFDMVSGRNFNRDFPDLEPRLAEDLTGKLTGDAGRNRSIVRQSLGNLIAGMTPRTELDALHLGLLDISHDADLVLDLHCSKESLLYLYTSEASWPDIEPLARLLRNEVSLLPTDSGGQSFDESNCLLWHRLQQRFAGQFPIEQGVVAATLEHRGMTDTTYEHAQGDAAAIVDYLVHRGDVSGEPLHCQNSHARRGNLPRASSYLRLRAASWCTGRTLALPSMSAMPCSTSSIRLTTR